MGAIVNNMIVRRCMFWTSFSNQAMKSEVKDFFSFDYKCMTLVTALYILRTRTVTVIVCLCLVLLNERHTAPSVRK